MRALPIALIVVYGLHRFALYAESKGWVFYRIRPPRVRMLGLLEELVEPEVRYMVEEQSSEAIRAVRDEFGPGASVTSMELADLEGRVYGPLPWRVAADAVSDFVSLTADDPARWGEHAPPGFAASALFAVAPDLLGELYDRSVVHGEQTFEWNSALGVGDLHEVSGTVTRVRERAGVHFLTFEMEATSSGEAVLSGRSLFLAGGEQLPAGQPPFERSEPPHSHRGDPSPTQRSASRSDLVRYAAATRDWNPVHWDHEAGVAAGFPGVVVHGLLQAGWALAAAGESTVGTRPFDSARFRFRSPLLPARPVDVSVVTAPSGLDVIISDADTEYLSATVVVSDE